MLWLILVCMDHTIVCAKKTLNYSLYEIICNTCAYEWFRPRRRSRWIDLFHWCIDNSNCSDKVLLDWANNTGTVQLSYWLEVDFDQEGILQKYSVIRLVLEAKWKHSFSIRWLVGTVPPCRQQKYMFVAGYNTQENGGGQLVLWLPEEQTTGLVSTTYGVPVPQTAAAIQQALQKKSSICNKNC